MDIREITRTYLYPLATMCSTIIGIGIFALPYVAATVGLPVMLAYLLVMGGLVTVVHVMFAELSLNTADYKRLAGFAKIYLGQWGKDLAIVSNIVGFFGIMLGFMSIGGEFLYGFLGPLLQGDPIFYHFAYLLAGAALIFFGINLVSRVGLWSLTAFFIIFGILAYKGAPFFDFSNLAAHTGSAKDIFFPYGAVLFAMWASSSIPEIEEMLGRRNAKGALKPIVATASLIAMLTYALFVALILGLTGAATQENALAGLAGVLGEGATSLFFLFALVTSFTSFIIQGLSLKRLLVYDMRTHKHVAQALITIIPIVLFLAGFNSFIDIFSLVGGVLLGLDGFLILLMYRKMRPERAWLTYLLMSIFAGGIGYQIYYYLLSNQ